MGQTLSAPATTKKSETGANGQYMFAVSEMQGWRITMEDAHATLLSVDESSADSNTFFAVYDGHGGGSVARFAGKHVHKRLVTEEAYREKRYEEALKRAFLGTDEDLLADPAHTRDPSGCTAVAALVSSDGKIYVANAGDSRSVISVKGEVKPLSFDHKPSSETEKARIVGAGGYVEYGRVNGNLALSRALGDFEFKKNYSLIPQKQIITSDPDVTVHSVTEEDEFLVLACDGIWDCLSSQQVVDYIRLKVSEGKELSAIGEMLCDHCLAPDTSSGAGIGCDNMTVLIVALLHGRTKEQWYQWVTDRVKDGYGYATPDTVPQIYAQSRLLAFRARQEAREQRERMRQGRDDSPSSNNNSLIGPSIVRLFESGGISLPVGTTIIGPNEKVMFGRGDDSEEDESGDDMDTEVARSLFSNNSSFGIENAQSADATQSLRDRLDAFERDIQDDEFDDEFTEGDIEGKANHIAENVDSGKANHEPINSSPQVNQNGLQGETPPPPKPSVNGDILPLQQLKSQPLGDEINPVVKADGFIDSSEDPLLV
ncbi:hypothetical protein SERLA73DRAFT_183367 [Serpula lacrymans var. lacrymans S7.3]|uniref:protein-serine/threonine phosphatase n=2 Tax=Serpula lacrymans var. lacrymans TaxID=341189 RepID=F8PZR7_SERL3|nr:uncharacterized protein SERLADRAFT_470458 [Serpula lacrymans var. lacrymans S7.9]EGN98389.1 hypothetical protein SERLA73DRAFT_183367 [Serpula lacrymans var. lacrymans S7.3]EGO23941.1 hypothetical protein SERLADRAFT_470458 [Serpula lacrymans var. lacrymans S7.9]